MLRDHKLLQTQSLVPAARNAAATVNGTAADLAGIEAVTVFFQVGVVTDGTHTPKIQESNDNSSFTDVAAGDQVGTLGVLVSSTGQQVGYRGVQRYVRAVLTTAGATTGAVASATIVRGHQQAADA